MPAEGSLAKTLRTQAVDRGWPAPNKAPVSAARPGAPPAPRGTPQSTIDALLYQLRPGLAGLEEEGARARLAACDEAAMRTIVTTLRARKAAGKSWLSAWSEADIAKLMATYEKEKR
jgi:hypothetical protein